MNHARSLWTLPLVAAILAPVTVAQTHHEHNAAKGFTPSIWGVELPVGDVDAAARFYVEQMGFTPVGQIGADSGPVLDNHGLKITFRPTDTPRRTGGPHLNINLSVPDLPSVVRAVREAGGTILEDEPLASAIGMYIPVLDPDGNHVHLIDLDGDEPQPSDPPKLYTVGFTVTDMEAEETFYTTLGFEVYSREYLPSTLPLVPVGAAMIVLHPVEGRPLYSDSSVSPVGSPLKGPVLESDARRSTLLLETEIDLKDVRDDLAARKLAMREAWDGLELRTPAGHRVRIISPVKTPVAISMDSVNAAEFFERFKSMAGEWMAKSTRGWEDRQVFSVIADGSAVMQISEFKDAPQNTMATMYHLDGDRLMLTHYCAAKNQPRLLATSHDGDGAITFEFLDITGIPSREEGHMDMAKFRFLPDGGFSERWTWYQDGQGRWMEDVVYRRVK